MDADVTYWEVQIPGELVPLDNDNTWLIRVKPWSQPERDPVWITTRALPFEGKAPVIAQSKGE